MKPWTFLISSVLMILQATVAPNLTIITNRMLFGPIWGGVLSWFAILIGASLCFALSKKFGKPLAIRFAGRSLQTVEKFLEKHGFPALLLARVTPFVPFDAVSYVAGIGGISYAKFVIATAIGLIPTIAIYTYIGNLAFAGLWWAPLAAGLLVTALWFGPRLLATISVGPTVRMVPAVHRVRPPMPVLRKKSNSGSFD